MDIKKIVFEIDSLNEDLKHHCNSYMNDSEYICLIDSQLNGKIKAIKTFCSMNNLGIYINLFEEYLPLENNAIEFFEFFSTIRDDILNTQKWLSGVNRNLVVLQIACRLQETMVKTDIDSYLSGFGIECSDQFYTVNSKRVYVQNVLRNVDNVKILSVANSLNLLNSDIVKTQIINKINNQFVFEQIDKCNDKIIKKDFDGAITNARSLIEEVLLAIEENVTGERKTYDGKLDSLYKRVSKIIRLEPDNTRIDNSLNEILRGFINIISGFSGISNKMADRHAIEYKPRKYHALLAVNTAMVFSEFLIDTYNFQKIQKNSSAFGARV